MRHKEKSIEQVMKAIQALTRYEIIAVPPSIEEIRKYLRVGSTRTVFRYLEELQTIGKIKKVRGRIIAV